MDRGAWWATVHGVTRVGHDLATEAPPYIYIYIYMTYIYKHIYVYIFIKMIISLKPIGHAERSGAIRLHIQMKLCSDLL